MVTEKDIISFYPEPSLQQYDFSDNTFHGVRSVSAKVKVVGQLACDQTAYAFIKATKLRLRAFGVDAEGYVTSYVHCSPVDGVSCVEFNYRVTGQPKMYESEPHPMCKSSYVTPQEADRYMRNREGVRKMADKIRFKYYVASPNVTTALEQAERTKDTKLAVQSRESGRWTRATAAECIAQATEMLEKDPSLEHVAVVKIVRVVRRKKLPVTVEVIN